MIFNPILSPWLVGIVLLVLLVLFSRRIIRRKDSLRDKILSFVRMAVIMALVFAINIRPMTETTDTDVQLKNVDVLFVVDNTMSMYARDYNGKHTRMSAVKEDCAYIIEQLDGSSFGLMKFDNRSQILAPFTQDSDNVIDAFEAVTMPDEYYANGTTLNTAYDDLLSMLLSSSKKEDRKTVVFFLSDGEITSGQDALMDYSKLAPYIDGGAVLGYGTEEGGTMVDEYDFTIWNYSAGEEAVSRIDESNLTQLANDLGVDYIHMTDSTDVDSVLYIVKTNARSVTGKQKAVLYDDVYYWFAIPLVFLLLLSLIRLIRKRRL